MKKKTKKILIAVGSVLGALIITAGVFYAVITVKSEKARAAAEEQMRMMERLAVEDRAIPVAEAYGVTDLKVEKLEGKYNSLACCTFSSEQFGNLSDRDRVMMLADIEMEFYNDKTVFPEESSLYGYRMFTDLKYNGKTYQEGTEDFFSYMIVNGTVDSSVKIPTEHAKAVSAGLERLMNTDVGGTGSSTRRSGGTGEPCPVCNGSGYVRYYTTNSALEAFLQGVPEYTTGTCSSCGGTGKR